ncbi:cell wall hydrolase [Novosphingobium soli]|uniref:Cell wall hydrolase n=1 Tax=Novosphingobium soli TaxID=574956 RepID=A0ABV6CPZ5_9SPHN
MVLFATAIIMLPLSPPRSTTGPAFATAIQALPGRVPRPTAPGPAINALGERPAITPQQINAAIPFANKGTERPAPFHLSPSDPAFARALDCLASAMLYEAGESASGQAAVAQVVLNRLRHPAFPHSVCAVVYQGSERTTGCQFTFTCDGSLARKPAASAWSAARTRASAFLTGRIDPSVGLATHYHTDWVHPFWSAALDKIARVETHLFFRWRGGWGRKFAFTHGYAGSEPVIAKLSALSDAHDSRGAGAGLPTLTLAPAAPAIAPDAIEANRRLLGPVDHAMLVDAGGNGGALALESLERCAERVFCKVIGWDRRSRTYGSPDAPAITTIAFLYVRDRRTGVEIVLWDCTRFNRPADAQCLSDRNRQWATFQGSLSRAL